MNFLNRIDKKKWLLSFPKVIAMLMVSVNLNAQQPLDYDKVPIGATHQQSQLNFIENKGQWPSEVKYLANVMGQHLWFTETGIRHEFYERTRMDIDAGSTQLPSFEPEPEAEYEVHGHVFDLQLVGAASAPVGLDEDKHTAFYNYFLGNDTSKWASNVALYNELWHREAYAGVDIHYYPTDHGLLEYDFIVDAGADPSQIRMNYQGLDGYFLDEDGNLQLKTSLGNVPVSAPYTYQLIDGEKREVVTRYTLNSDGEIGFEFPEGYDPALALIIDPVVLEWSTFLHASDSDEDRIYALELDSQNRPVVTGQTYTANFPSTIGGFTGTPGILNCDIFVSKFSADGTVLVFSTFVGGSNRDRGYDIALDNGNNIFLTGLTMSDNFPLSVLAPFDGTYNFGNDAFVTKLNSTGSAIVYSTYLGGSGADQGTAIAIDNAGLAVIAGNTGSSQALSIPFPLVNPYDASCIGSDVFVTKMNSLGSGLVYSTYFGGSGMEGVSPSIVLDASDNIILAGSTLSAENSFPLTPGAFDPTNPPTADYDGFLSKLSSDGQNLVFSTFLGGDELDGARSVTLDGAGNIIVGGYTRSYNFPTSAPLYSSLNGTGAIPPFDAFVAKFTSSGNILFSTYLGGSADESLSSVKVDNNDDIVVLGSTASANFPMVPGFTTYQASNDGNDDIYLARLSSAGDQLLFSTYIGGGADDIAQDYGGDCLAVVGECYYVGGTTQSMGFPTTSGAFQDTKMNGSDSAPVVFQLCDIRCPEYATVPSISTPTTVCSGQTFNFTVDVINCSPGAGSTMNVTIPGGAVVSQALTNCSNHTVQLSLNNANYCTAISVALPWSIVCDFSGEVISSGTYTITVNPQVPTASSQVVNIAWNASTCSWDVSPQNDCDQLDIGSIFNITPNPSSLPSIVCAGGNQNFTVQYNGILPGPNCCASAAACQLTTLSPYTCCIPVANGPTTPADVTVTANCAAAATAPLPAVIPVVNDACGTPIVPIYSTTSTPNPVTCTGTVVHRYTYTDCVGNSDVWNYTYTINDNVPPTGTAPANISITAGTPIPVANINLITDEADNCGSFTVTHVGDASDGGTCPEIITRTYRLTDQCGNTTDLVQIITIGDSQNPTASDPPSSTYECQALVPLPDPAVVIDEADNNGVPVVTFQSEYTLGNGCTDTVYRTYRVTDACGNFIDVTHLIYITRTTPPVVPVNGGTTVDCWSNAVPPSLPAVSSVCGDLLIPIDTIISPDLTCNGTKTYTYNYQDCAGNQAIWEYEYTVDLPAFTISAPDGFDSVDCVTDLYVPTSPTITDACGNNLVPVMTENADPVCVGDKVYTFTYTDCANSTADWTFTIHVEDTVAPTADPLPAISVATAQAVPAYDINDVQNVADNCTALPLVAWIGDVSDGEVCNGEVITRSYSITDDCGNADTLVQVITITAMPPLVSAGQDQLICVGDSVVLTADNPDNAQITWMPSTVQDGVPFYPTQSDQYQVTAELNGCSSVDTVEVLVEALPLVSFEADALVGCTPAQINFTNTSSAESAFESCFWNIEGIGSAEDCGTVSFTFTEEGYFSPTLVVTTVNGCTAEVTYDDFIYIDATPTAAFTSSTLILDDMMTQVDFTNNSTNADMYFWEFGDGESSELEHPSHVYLYDEDMSEYIVELTAYTEWGCTDTATLKLIVEEQTIYFVPNSFSPDGNGVNDSFRPVFVSGFDPKDFELTIRNRWGEVIWESHDVTEEWDGTFNGQPVQNGTYVWMIVFRKSQNAERITETGHVNLIR